MTPAGSPHPGADLPPARPLTFLVAIFALEVFGLVGLARWGWSLGNGGGAGAVAAIGMVLAAAAVWGLFRVPNDPPGKVDPPVRVPGWPRLLIELSFYALASAGLWLSGWRAASETLMTAVAIIYLVMWDRQRWLVRQP